MHRLRCECRRMPYLHTPRKWQTFGENGDYENQKERLKVPCTYHHLPIPSTSFDKSVWNCDVLVSWKGDHCGTDRYRLVCQLPHGLFAEARVQWDTGPGNGGNGGRITESSPIRTSPALMCPACCHETNLAMQNATHWPVVVCRRILPVAPNRVALLFPMHLCKWGSGSRIAEGCYMGCFGFAMCHESAMTAPGLQTPWDTQHIEKAPHEGCPSGLNGSLADGYRLQQVSLWGFMALVPFTFARS